MKIMKAMQNTGRIVELATFSGADRVIANSLSPFKELTSE
jgi:hypothetical protein